MHLKKFYYLGNVHIEDDNGRLFYVAGRVNERAVVCDEDKPIMTRLIELKFNFSLFCSLIIFQENSHHFSLRWFR